MKLQEKILYSRKKAGLSQEALADQLGVSRQAISKWETGDAVPEINKLILLAKAFEVTTDWLLSEEPFQETEIKEPINKAVQNSVSASSWIDALPGFIGKMYRTYGWLIGVYLAFIGTSLTALGALAKYLVKQMFGPILADPFDTMFDSTFTNIIANNPVSIMGTFMMIVGVVLMIGGITLAIVLRKRSQETVLSVKK